MRFFRLSATLILLLAAWAGAAQAGANSELYGPYQQILDRFLTEKVLPDDGLVSAFDYEAALNQQNLTERLSMQRKALKEFDLSRLQGEAESVAFWINAYNFFMLDQILTEKPDGELVSSVWDYGGRINPFVDSVFARKKFVVDGQQYSLDQIEKEILLGAKYSDKGWKDARVHFAVNCAAVGCPPLRKDIYTADNLETTLANNIRRAFNTDRHLRVEGSSLYVTELFKWYETDFVEASGSRRAFIQQWAEPSVAKQVAETTGLGFIDYDWSLNRPANFLSFR